MVSFNIQTSNVQLVFFNPSQIRIQGLVCVGKLITGFDRWIVQDQVLPFLHKIQSREPGILMAMLGVYKTALTNDKLGRYTNYNTCSKFTLKYYVLFSSNIILARKRLNEAFEIDMHKYLEERRK